MRVLFTNQPALGHWHPLVPLAQALQTAGHEVAFASTPNFCPTIEAGGFPCLRAGIDETDEELQYRRNYLEAFAPYDRASYMLSEIFAGKRAEQSLTELIDIMRDWRPDILVHDDLELAGCVAADVAGIPHTVFQLTAPRARFLPTIDAPLNRLRASVGLPTLNPAEILYRYLLLFPRPLSLWEPSVPVPPTTHVFRYTGFNRSGEEQLPDWVAGLQSLPLVYATLGTMQNYRSPIFTSILEGLGNQQLNLILTIGRDQDPAFFGPQPPNVHIERYIPQSLLLPYCDLVLNHGGSGTVMDSLSHGIPMVILPIGADQPENARICANLGAASIVPPDQHTPELIREAVLDVLQTPTYTQAAQKLQREIQSLPDLDYPIALLEKLAAQRTPILANH